MHEMHLLNNLLADLLALGEKNQACQITKIYLRMGIFTEINPGILKHFFSEKARGTIAENAEIVIEPSEARELVLLSFDCN